MTAEHLGTLGGGCLGILRELLRATLDVYLYSLNQTS